MPVRLAINGFGRIGRILVRNIFDDPGFEIVAINSRGSAAFYAHLLMYDSSYGTWQKDIHTPDDDHLVINGKSIQFFREMEATPLPWGKLGVDVVVESTGAFRSREESEKHIAAGARKVVITAPATDDDITLIPGVNGTDYDASKHAIVSAASCTSHCLATVVEALNSELEIVHGYFVTVHAYTNDQHLVDAPHKNEDFRRARAAPESIIPTATGADQTISRIMPKLKGKLRGIAMRVPVVLPSVITLTAEVAQATTVERVNMIFQQAAAGKMAGILAYSDKPLVSVDYRGNPHAAIIDGLSTEVIDGTLVNVVAWYDNEWGYVNQLVKVIKLVGTK